MKESFSPYVIHWIEFRPISGIVPLRDIKILAKFPFIAKTYSRKKSTYMEHFPNKKSAIEYLEINKDKFTKLSKPYEVRLCTDKQFGMGVFFTKKQEQDMFIIGL